MTKTIRKVLKKGSMQRFVGLEGTEHREKKKNRTKRNKKKNIYYLINL